MPTICHTEALPSNHRLLQVRLLYLPYDLLLSASEWEAVVLNAEPRNSIPESPGNIQSTIASVLNPLCIQVLPGFIAILKSHLLDLRLAEWLFQVWFILNQKNSHCRLLCFHYLHYFNYLDESKRTEWNVRQSYRHCQRVAANR